MEWMIIYVINGVLLIILGLYLLSLSKDQKKPSAKYVGVACVAYGIILLVYNFF